MNTIEDLMAALTVGSPARHRNLSVYPLRSEGKRATAAYLVLDDALATGRFRITEVSESGSVPRLLAINDNGSPVILLDGEELVGAKQNRVLNLSIMLAPKSRTEIPVSCVEAGRWQTESHAFRAAQRVQFAGGRAQKMDQVSRSLFLNGEATSDQVAIWDAIATTDSQKRDELRRGADQRTTSIALSDAIAQWEQRKLELSVGGQAGDLGARKDSYHDGPRDNSRDHALSVVLVARSATLGARSAFSPLATIRSNSFGNSRCRAMHLKNVCRAVTNSSQDRTTASRQ